MAKTLSLSLPRAGALTTILLATLLTLPIQVVTSQDTKSPPRFAYESNPLTDETLKTLLTSRGSDSFSPSVASLFAFDSSPTAPGDRLKSGACRVFPGDATWPAPEVWDGFDELLLRASVNSSGGLIKTIPLAAPCYENLGVLNSERCAAIQKGWSDGYLQ